MNKYVKNLKAVMKETRISLETASRLIGCSSKTVYRWLTEESNPRPASEQLIKNGIEKIKEEFPDFNFIKARTAFHKAFAIAKERRKVWDRIKRKLSKEDKVKVAELMLLREKEQMEQFKKLDQKYNE